MASMQGSGERFREDQRGSALIEYLCLLAAFVLAAVALIGALQGSVRDSALAVAGKLGAPQSRPALTGMGSRPSSELAAYPTRPGTVALPPIDTQKPLNLQLVSAHTGGSGSAGDWVRAFAGGLWDRKGQILLSAGAIALGVIVIPEGLALMAGGTVATAGGPTAVVGIPAFLGGAVVTGAGIFLVGAGAYGLGDAIVHAASEANAASSGDTASSSSGGASQASEEELRARSKEGDVEATLELNRRKAAAARAAGDAEGARGHENENEVLESLDDLQEAGRVVEYQTSRGKVRTDIDGETSRYVIQIKSGSKLPDPNQAEATRRRAEETHKTAKVIYDPTRVPANAVRDFQQRYPDIVLEPRRFGR